MNNRTTFVHKRRAYCLLRKGLNLFFFFQLGFTHPGPKTNGEVELHFKEQ